MSAATAAFAAIGLRARGSCWDEKVYFIERRRENIITSAALAYIKASVSASSTYARSRAALSAYLRG
jgi:hypothetical protein